MRTAISNPFGSSLIGLLRCVDFGNPSGALRVDEMTAVDPDTGCIDDGGILGFLNGDEDGDGLA